MQDVPAQDANEYLLYSTKKATVETMTNIISFHAYKSQRQVMDQPDQRAMDLAVAATMFGIALQLNLIAQYLDALGYISMRNIIADRCTEIATVAHYMRGRS